MKRSGFFGTIAGAFSSMYNKVKDKRVYKKFENFFHPNFKELHDKTVQKIIEDLQEYNNPPF
jgi:hypothetical protein